MEKDQIDQTRLSFGRRLAAARESKGFSQLEIATRFGIHKGTVSAWETGRGDPGVFRLKDLAALYATSCDALLGDGGRSAEAEAIAAEFDALSPAKKKQIRAVWTALLGN